MHGEEANNTTLDDMTLLTEGNWYTCLPYKTRFDHGDLFPKLRDNSGRIVSLDDNNTVVLRLDRGASIFIQIGSAFCFVFLVVSLHSVNNFGFVGLIVCC
eukprot:INCI3723.2.p2 GENE.INCI3723.2~~INCI3723.2.p2  ORF type:complete len:100 (+),score=4.05 INCI3723.2:519-818(+)